MRSETIINNKINNFLFGNISKNREESFYKL